MKIFEREVQNLMVKSKLPDADWVINPYIGCTHRCRYCYGVFMRRFCKCEIPWGDFLIVKNGRVRGLNKVQPDQVILIGSVTDAYQPVEKKYRRTRAILEQLLECDTKVEILTKSKLVLLDMDLLKKFRNIRVGISLNTLNEKFCRETEPGASGVEDRIDTLKELKKAGITTYLFVSPIFPMITDLEEIIEKTRKYVDIFCFENLNLRGDYKKEILQYIDTSWKEFAPVYREIYVNGDMSYWEQYKKTIQNLAEKYDITVKEYFYHEKIRKQ